MKLMGKRARLLLLFCLLFFAGLLFFLYSYATGAPRWAAQPVNRHVYNQGQLTVAGSIFDRNGEVLAETVDGVRRFHENAAIREALMHLTGDAVGNVATGLQVSHRAALSGWNLLTGVYNYDRTRGKDITAAVDARLCRTAYRLLEGRRGTVGLMNYKTGEILCMVSAPSFDPAHPPDVSRAPDKYEGVYLNRFLSSSFVPGSIFKLVTAAAALETSPDVKERTFSCEGILTLDGGRITCPQAHGTQTFGEAMTHSCNVAFAQLSVELGPTLMERYAERAGLGVALRVDGIAAAPGSFDLEEASEADIGWSGVGQYKTMINPLSYLCYVAAIANEGRAVAPCIVKKVGSGYFEAARRLLETPVRVMPEEIAASLRTLMRDNVVNNYGEGALAEYRLCGKTGTAEVGGGKPAHSWFVGFLDSEKAPLCFLVLVENGGTGSAAAAGVAKKLLAEAVNYCSAN